MFVVSPMPEEAASVTAFDIKVWNTPTEPGTSTLEELLAAATEVATLPHNTSGNTSNGAVVPELEDNYPDFYNPSKFQAWKIHLNEESSLYVRSDMALVLYKSDGMGGYEYVDYDWNGNISCSGDDVLSAGDYYIVGAFDEVDRADGDFWLKIATNEGDLTALNTAEAKAYTVYTDGNAVYASGVEAGLPYALYSISGSIVAQGTTASDVLSINVPQKGVYILRIGAQVQKVLVK